MLYVSLTNILYIRVWRPRQYSRGCEKSTIILRLLLHMIFGLACIFGLPATLNDITVVDHSPVLKIFYKVKLLEWIILLMGTIIKWVTITPMRYYPEWAIILQSDSLIILKRHYFLNINKLFKRCWASFWVLQARVATIKNQLFWDKKNKNKCYESMYNIAQYDHIIWTR